MNNNATLEQSTIRSDDGTAIGYHSIGTGPGLIVVGGVLCTGLDYADLAVAMSDRYTVHLVDRRGRGLSGPQHDSHSIDDECNDLISVAAATGAAKVFGHSFGGLVALEAARRSQAFDRVTVYEPGVPVEGGLRLGWLDRYDQLLTDGHRRAAFACMVKGAGFAPGGLSVLPLWYVRAVLRLAVRGARWASIEPHLESNRTEHRLQRSLTTPTVDRFHDLDVPVVLLGGQRSPRFVHELLAELHSVIDGSILAMLPGLGHMAPHESPQTLVAASAKHDATRS